jgi:hypothetical protein
MALAWPSSDDPAMNGVRIGFALVMAVSCTALRIADLKADK